VSLTGTYTAPGPTDGGNNQISTGSQYHPPTIKSLKDLMQTAAEVEATKGKKKLNLLVCTSTDPKTQVFDKCEPKDDIEIVSMSALVHRSMDLLKDSVVNNAALAGTDLNQVKILIENTPLPILKMAIYDGVQGTGLTTTKYEHIIAYEYTNAWLERMSKLLSRPLASLRGKSEGEKEAIKSIHENLNNLRETARDELAIAYAVAANETGIVRMLQENSNKFFSSFPAIQNSILFGQNGQ
jgi:hypothetical protein